MLLDNVDGKLQKSWGILGISKSFVCANCVSLFVNPPSDLYFNLSFLYNWMRKNYWAIFQYIPDLHHFPINTKSQHLSFYNFLATVSHLIRACITGQIWHIVGEIVSHMVYLWATIFPFILPNLTQSSFEFSGCRIPELL